MGYDESRLKTRHHGRGCVYRDKDAISSIFSVCIPPYYSARMLIIHAISYGSIYFASDTVDGAVPAQITGEAPPELKEQVSKTFTIGPTVHRDFWNKERSKMDIFRGPCRY